MPEIAENGRQQAGRSHLADECTRRATKPIVQTGGGGDCSPLRQRRDVKRVLLTFAVFSILVAAGCGNGPASENSSGVSTPVARTGPVSMNKADYPVFPDADAGADPSVSAEQGGKGFTGKGWETNTEFDLIGDPHAVKGGLLRETVPDFPSTLRPFGPNTTQFSTVLGGLVYEQLLGMHPTTLEYYPALATHWQISADKTTYRFRIDPNARWSDGQPVTADDVVASWSFSMDKGVNDPALPVVFGKFEKPVAESKYIVRVKAIQPSWRNFMYFSSSLPIFPAHALKTIDGAAWVRDYNYKMLPGSGPYAVAENDVEKGNTIHVRRRSDYWAAKYRRSIGINNFDDIQVLVVRDRNLEFEKFKKGDLDFYFVNRAQMWAEQLNFPDIDRGLIQKRRIWNNNPQGVQGFALNTRRAPFDDIRVRKALALLFNREEIVAKLMYGAYEPIDSDYPGSMWENPDDEQVKYDPEQALKLLSQAGYTSRDSQGRLTRNGIPLAVELIYGQQDSEKYLTVYQEDLRKVGITLNLRLVTFETMVKLLDDRQFGMVSMAYTGLLFPNPETSLLSSLADQKNNNNITGFKNARVDQLLKQYDLAYDVPQRVKIIREIDKIVTDAHHFIFEWYAPNQRIAFWNRFGMPKGEFSRIGDVNDILSMWWIDPDKDAKLQQALRNPSVKLDVGQTEDRYWQEYDKKAEAAR
jgi:microcin C transport system substrate-binding protein